MKKEDKIPKSGGWLSRFGWPKKKWTQENVEPINQITPELQYMFGAGVTSVTSLLGLRGKKEARNRQIIYEKWMRMEADPIISSAIQLLVTAALGGHETSGDLVFIEKKTEIGEKDKLNKIVDEIRADLTPLFNRVAYQIAYTGAIFGDSYARIYTDANQGVIDLYVDELVRPPLVQPYEQGSKTIGFSLCTSERSYEKLDILQMARLKMPRTQWVPQFGVLEKNLRVQLTEDDIHNVAIMPSMVGGSFLYNAEEPYDNLNASLLGLVGQRWIDSIDEQMYAVNLQSSTEDQQQKLLNSITKMLLKSKQLAEESVKKGYPNLERIRYVIPTYNDKQLVSVNPPAGSGRTANITIDDVMVHAKLLAGALGVDLSLLGFADLLSGGLGEGGFFRTSAQAAERSRVIRVALTDFFNWVIDVHTFTKYGVVFEPEKRPWNINYFGSISALEAEKQRTKADAMNAGLTVIQAMQAMKEMGADKKVLSSFLTKTMMLDEADAELYSKIVDTPDQQGQEGDEFAPPEERVNRKEEEEEPAPEET